MTQGSGPDVGAITDPRPAGSPVEQAPSSQRGIAVAAFTISLTTGAGLLFAVQPMFARFVLPLVGGSPAVWTVSVMFFQAALLAGYAYADWSVRRWGVRRQALVHIAVVAAPLLALPIGLPAGWAPPPGGEPAWWLLAALAVGVGLPFFALATSAPVLQRWFAELPHPRAGDPYFLYAASNLGSFVGLLAYPLLLEPAVGLRGQARLWSVGYLLWAALVAGCAVAVLRARSAESPRALDSADGADTADSPATTPGRSVYLRWIALAFIPCSLLLGVTTTLTVDLAPIPLLWVVPLAIYLLTYVVAFSGSRPAAVARRAAQRVFPVLGVLVLVALMFEARRPLWLVAVVHLVTFGAAALACHGRLAAERPHPRFLTRFYLCLAFGGALGGVVNSLLAPAVFNSLLEYPIALLLVFFFLPRRAAAAAGRWEHLRHLVPIVTGVTLAAAILAGPVREGASATRVALLLSSCALVASLALLRRPALVGLVAAVLFAAATGSGSSRGSVLLVDRNFYGTLQVASVDQGRYHVLRHGTTLHGAQRVGDGALEPLTYYNRSGPLADIIRALQPSGRTAATAVVGLGTGTTACLAGSADEFTFYEINPLVVRIARDPGLFTYLRDCPGEHRVVLGDARLSLADAAPGAYGLIILDAFTSDAIPVHLLTREAFQLYDGRLGDAGVIAAHVSNRYADLEPVIGRVAAAAGMGCLTRDSIGSASPYENPSSRWVAVAHHPADFGELAANPGWRPCGAEAPLWTDDYANVAGVLRLG
jgi:hypothetical protein